jgi:D-alanine--(R)-lactate ligase
MDRLRIGILFGGVSEEHPVSIKSAVEVAGELDLAKYEPFYIGITQAGEWKLCDGPGPDWEVGARAAALSPDRSVHGLLVADGQGLGGERSETIRLDVVLPLLHGRQGEDGAVQGLLELSGIPYVGCDIQSSALCMDKSLAYTVVRAAGIPTPEFRIVAAGQSIDPDLLTYPVFVKPARSGSSFGVSKVTSELELAGAIEEARQYDAKVLIEQAVDGIEVGCAILGNDSVLMMGELDQVALTHGFFRIHQEATPETGSENASFIVPADIPQDAAARVRETAKAIYRTLGCTGIARVDLFLAADGRVILNEVNTMPGMTSYSRYPRMMAAAGMPLPVVIDQLVTLAFVTRSATPSATVRARPR